MLLCCFKNCFRRCSAISKKLVCIILSFILLSVPCFASYEYSGVKTTLSLTDDSCVVYESFTATGSSSTTSYTSKSKFTNSSSEWNVKTMQTKTGYFSLFLFGDFKAGYTYVFEYKLQNMSGSGLSDDCVFRNAYITNDIGTYSTVPETTPYDDGTLVSSTSFVDKINNVSSFEVYFNIDEDAKCVILNNSYKVKSQSTLAIRKCTLGMVSAYYDEDGSVEEGLILEKLDKINSSIESGNAQAHSDSVEVQKKIDNINDKQEQKTQENYKGQESVGDVSDTLSIDDFKGAITNLFNALSYSGSDSVWKFPATGVVPFLGVELWSEQNINLTEWLFKLPSVILTVVRFLFVFGVAWVIIRDIMSLVKFFSKGDDDD